MSHPDPPWRLHIVNEVVARSCDAHMTLLPEKVLGPGWSISPASAGAQGASGSRRWRNAPQGFSTSVCAVAIDSRFVGIVMYSTFAQRSAKLAYQGESTLPDCPVDCI